MRKRKEIRKRLSKHCLIDNRRQGNRGTLPHNINVSIKQSFSINSFNPIILIKWLV